jgi:PhnB protein
MKFNVYLHFKGDCAEAFAFYAKVLDQPTPSHFSYGESPMAGQTPPDMKDKVMHTRITVGDQTIMGSDTPPQMYAPMGGFTVNIGVDTPEEAERIFAALSEGAEVTMAMQETFWAKRYGMLKDKFGVPWMVNCEKPMG